MKGIKYDTGKPRWSLLPWREIGEVVEVLTIGAIKYEDDNWMRVPQPKERYFSAGMRHFTAWAEGEVFDPETGKNHLAHAICCLLFLMWFDNEDLLYPYKSSSSLERGMKDAEESTKKL